MVNTIAYRLVKASFYRVHSWLEFYSVYYEYVINPPIRKFQGRDAHISVNMAPRIILHK